MDQLHVVSTRCTHVCYDNSYNVGITVIRLWYNNVLLIYIIVLRLFMPVEMSATITRFLYGSGH